MLFPKLGLNIRSKRVHKVVIELSELFNGNIVPQFGENSNVSRYS